jgi:hypothetical protein
MSGTDPTTPGGTARSHYEWVPPSSASSQKIIESPEEAKSKKSDIPIRSQLDGTDSTEPDNDKTSFRPHLPSRSSFNYSQALSAAMEEDANRYEGRSGSEKISYESQRPKELSSQTATLESTERPQYQGSGPSWNEQDMKRKMQERLLSGKEKGFSQS